MTTLEAAAATLGWHGALIPDVRLLGTHVAVVATVDDDRLRERLAQHPQPMYDADTLAIWEWPDCGWPPSPVRIVGVIADQATCRRGRALQTAADWRGFAPTAVLLSGLVAEDITLMDADFAGVAVLARTTGRGVRLVQEGAPTRSERSRRQTADRWVEEHLFAMLPDRRPAVT